MTLLGFENQMIKLKSLKKEVKDLSKGTSLAGYVNSNFIRAAERELLLLQHLSPEVREKIIQYAQEGYSDHISLDPENPENEETIRDLIIADVFGIIDWARWLWRNFGFFGRTISELISPRYPHNEVAYDSVLWFKFWQCHGLKLDLFEEEFQSNQYGISTADDILYEDFYMPENWSRGIDKKTRQHIINFSEWGEVIFINRFDPDIKTKLLIRWSLMEKVKIQFLEKKIVFPDGQEEAKSDKGKYPPHKAIPATEEETKTNKSEISILIVNNNFPYQQPESVNQEKGPGPADKLSKASGWMDPIVKDIVGIESPLSSHVIDVFEKHYPGFKEKYYDGTKSRMADGENVNKNAVSRALAYLYDIKGYGSINKDSIRKRYEKMSLW